ncbi:MAG: hypothetical protein CMJ74_12060 [Planctomycetaceae bacterium]|nr:hypothetical protein [Planctomycetaceae bacterium]|tara:strand:- start:7713 stop:8921 length:1209 start_codon:yes stop_codon:yes gene_type:complete
MSRLLFSEQASVSFGSSLLPARTARQPGQLFEVTQSLEPMRKLIRTSIPPVPGVYAFYDRCGTIIYVGKAKRLRHRLISYFTRQPEDHKAVRIVRRAAFVRYERVAGELLALLREQELISRFRPVMNRRGQPRSRMPRFVSFSCEMAPRLRAVRARVDLGGGLHGPLLGSRRLRSAVADFNHTFLLRDCGPDVSIIFSEQQTLFPEPLRPGCLRLETGSCSGPCAAEVTAADYTKQIHAGEQFLRGETSTAVLRSIEQSMHEAANRKSYEWAARLRDRWQNLRWLADRLGEVRLGRESYNAVYPLEGIGQTPIWLYLAGGAVAGAVSAPGTIRSARRVGRDIDALSDGLPQSYLLRADVLLLQLIVLGWLRRNPLERRKLISLDVAREYCENMTAGKLTTNQ